MMSPEQREIWQEVLRLSEKGDTTEAVRGFEILMEETEGLIQRMLLFVMVAANAIMAIILGLIKSEPRENKHGPVPAGA